MTILPNKITAHNPGWRSQFRFAVHGFGSGVCEFWSWTTLNAMRCSLRILTLFALFLTACAPSPSTKPLAIQSGPVGTWRWVSVDKQQVTEPFHIRYYADGASVSWPAPEGWSTTNGVSHGRYHLEGSFLVIETGEGTNDPRVHLEIKGDEMVLINDESNRLVYRRVVPDLEPGK